MNLCFLICGLPRCLELTLFNIEEKFYNYKINYYICLSNNESNYEKEYINNNNLKNIFNNKNIKKIIFINDEFDNSFRNSFNYIKKINDLIKIVEEDYDLYIIIRSDLSFESIDFLNYIKNEQTIYFSKNNLNNYIKTINNKINDNIFISKNIKLLKNTIENLYKQLLLNNNYLDIILYNYTEHNKINYELINICYKLILSECNIIAISGDSGSGKTTLCNKLLKLFDKENYSKIETDRYHKWERGDENYKNYTHLNPYANHLEKMNEDIYKLKIGHEIFSVDYDHNTGKFTQEEKIESNKNIILCGLHTLYNDKTNKILNLKIFLDTDRELIKKWKVHRDVNERGYSINKVLKQIDDRENDYEKYIKEQKNNADIIINFFEENNKIHCRLFIKKINSNNIINMLHDNYKLEISNQQILIYLEYNVNTNAYYDDILKIIDLIIN